MTAERSGDGTEEFVEVVFHPAKHQPFKAAFLGFALGIAFQALWQALEPLTAVILSLLLLASVRDFFLETRYRLGFDGVSVAGVLKPSALYSWKRFRTFVEDRNGLFLSPYRGKRRLEQQRGVFLPMGREDRLRAAEYCAARNLVRRPV